MPGFVYQYRVDRDPEQSEFVQESAGGEEAVGISGKSDNSRWGLSICSVHAGEDRYDGQHGLSL